LCSHRGLAPLLGFLAAQGLLGTGEQAPASAAEMLMARFGRYLRDERALSASTAGLYLKRARRFLDRCAADGDVAGLTAGQVTEAVLAECGAVSTGSAQYFVTALRSFLRFCHWGLTGTDLSATALAVTGRRPSRHGSGGEKTIDRAPHLAQHRLGAGVRAAEAGRQPVGDVAGERGVQELQQAARGVPGWRQQTARPGLRRCRGRTGTTQRRRWLAADTRGARPAWTWFVAA
jgi:hypothetical protein